MLYRDTKCRKGVALQAAEASVGIEITPAMADAGGYVLASELGDAVEIVWLLHDLAVSVFQAAAAVQTRGHDRRSS